MNPWVLGASASVGAAAVWIAAGPEMNFIAGVALVLGWALAVDLRNLERSVRSVRPPLPRFRFAVFGRIARCFYLAAHQRSAGPFGQARYSSPRSDADVWEPEESDIRGEEEAFRRAYTGLARASSAAACGIAVVNESGDLVFWGDYNTEARFHEAFSRRYGEALRRGAIEELRSGSIEYSSVVMGLNRFGCDYVEAAVFIRGRADDGKTRWGLVWLGYTEDSMPSDGERSRIERIVRVLEQDLRLVNAVNDLSSRVAAAESRERVKSDFIAHISHDIRSPLNNIRAILTLLKCEEASVETANMLDIALQNCDGLGEIVEDVLDFTRYNAGKLAARVEDIDLGGAAQSVVEALRFSARQKSLELRYERGGPAVRVEADPRHVKRILTNIIGNALKYTERGRVIVALFDNESGCGVRVQDTGIGISSSDLERLFTPFSRVERGAGDGVGLGLALTKILVELNGGSIKVRSKLHSGSEFEIRFPRCAETASSERPKVCSPVCELNASERRVSALLVDDDSDSCRSLARALSVYGVEGVVAATVADAVSIINFSRPDIVITDAKMPHGGGASVLEFARTSGLDTPIFLLSGFGHADEAKVWLDAGAAAVFQKPVDVGALWRAIEGAVYGRIERRPPISGAT